MLTLPAGADGCCDIPQALAESRQVLKYLIGRGAVEDAREGIRRQKDGRKPQRDEHDHRQCAQALAHAATTRTTLVERKLLRI